MSQESAVAFYEKLESDTELTARIQELQTREAIGQYVREELGYDFSLEEMQKVIFERNPEITDEEMEAVVGGQLDTFSMLVGATAGLGALGIAGAIAAAAAA
jgi:predicted ribosomally synthesized peptide with nif11-like leader